MPQKSHFFDIFRYADTWILLLTSLLTLLFLGFDIHLYLDASRTNASPMWRVILLALLCLLLYLGALLYRDRTGSSVLIQPILLLSLLLYLYLLLSLTLVDQSLRLSADRLAEAGLSKREYYLKWFVNFRPLESIYTVYIRGLIKGYVSMRYTLLNLLGNLCAFMPLAFFLPALFPKLHRWYFFLPTVTLSVAAVEGLQFLLMVGSCDIDDLILNAGGAMILFALLKIPPLRRFCDRVAKGAFSLQ